MIFEGYILEIFENEVEIEITGDDKNARSNIR